MLLMNKRVLLYGLNVVLSVLILVFLYAYRFMAINWYWMRLLFIVYGLVITPFIIFRIVWAYLYKPVSDCGYRPLVSVIVPVYNEEAVIGDVIEAILQSEYPVNKLELIVIDDKSTDKTMAVINKKRLVYDFKVVELDENMGKRHAMAAGVKQCIGEVLVCIDSDTLVKVDAVKMLVQPFIDERVYCVCGNAIVTNESNPKANTLLARFQKVWYADGFRLRKGVESLFGMVICCSGVLSAYRRDKFERVMDDWLNETFLGCRVQAGDDRRMTNLMLQMGGKSVFQSTAIAYTFAPYELSKFFKQQVRWGRSSFRGMLFASTFFYKKSWHQTLIFYVSAFVTFVSPVSLFVNTVGLAIIGNYTAIILYFLGLLLISSLIAISDKLLVDYFSFKDIFYRAIFFVIMIPVTFIYLYAWFTPWKGTVWGTR